MEKKFVSVVVYLYNDEKNIEEFISTVLPEVQNSFEHYEAIFVDDKSDDKTIERLKEGVSNGRYTGMISIVKMENYQGLEASMNAGRDIAIGDFVYEFDTCIVNYDAGMITESFELLSKGNDIVTVSDSKGGRLSSRMFYGIFNTYSKSHGNICTETFRIVSRRAINRIKSMGDYIPYRKAVYAACGLNTKRLYYTATGGKKIKKEKQTYERMTLAMDSFIYFTNFLERVSTILSLFFLVSTVGLLIYALVDYIKNKSAIEGWTSLICFISFGFFGIFLLLTILLKYMSTMINLIFKKQNYLVSSIEKVGHEK
ncbi:MAG: glycosyltransferase [Lachnospiraceae bacterium]|nr:glycosyltransferase [Lachnospiraceae bacterium]